MTTAAWPSQRLFPTATLLTRRKLMLYTIAAVLVVLWLLGFGAFHVTSSLIHLVLVLAVVAVVLQLFRGRTV
ncbi:MAG: hypothetical protein NVS3B20_16120 [Polyangiales bacterium]